MKEQHSNNNCIILRRCITYSIVLNITIVSVEKVLIQNMLFVYFLCTIISLFDNFLLKPIGKNAIRFLIGSAKTNLSSTKAYILDK